MRYQYNFPVFIPLSLPGEEASGEGMVLQALGPEVPFHPTCPQPVLLQLGNAHTSATTGSALQMLHVQTDGCHRPHANIQKISLMPMQLKAPDTY